MHEQVRVELGTLLLRKLVNGVAREAARVEQVALVLGSIARGTAPRCLRALGRHDDR